MLVNIINFLITLLFIFPVDNVVERLSNPSEHEIFLRPSLHDSFIQWLEIGYDSDKGRKRNHGSQ
jgi:hypothetical protein